MTSATATRDGSKRARTVHRGAAAVLAALLAGATTPAAAERAGVSASTVKRCKADPDFVAEWRRAEAEMVGETKAVVRSNLRRAAEVTAELMEEGYPAAVRLRAAAQAFDAYQKMQSDYEARLAALEERVGHQGHARFNGNGRY